MTMGPLPLGLLPAWLIILSRIDSSLLDGNPARFISYLAYRTMSERLTLKIQMGGPVPLDMGDHPLPTSMKTWVILYADPGAGGIEVVESRW